MSQDEALELARKQFEEWVTKMEPAYADSNLERLTGGRGGYKVHNVACWWMAWQACSALIRGEYSGRERGVDSDTAPCWSEQQLRDAAGVSAERERRLAQALKTWTL